MNINTKSNFLQKKKQERKKTQDKIETKSKMLAVQKNIRAFLARQKIMAQSYLNNNLQLLLLLGADISLFNFQIFQAKLTQILKMDQQNNRRSYLLRNLIISSLKTQQSKFLQAAKFVIEEEYQNIREVFQTKKYIEILNKLLKSKKGYIFLDYSWEHVKTSPFSCLVSCETLFDISIKQQIESEGFHSKQLKLETCLSLLSYIHEKQFRFKDFATVQFQPLVHIFQRIYSSSNIYYFQNYYNALSLIINLLFSTLRFRFDAVVKSLLEKNQFKTLYQIVQDEEQLQYLQHRIKRDPQFSQFTERTIVPLKKIFSEVKALHRLMNESSVFREALVDLLRQIRFIFDDRHLLFIYEFLSEESSLRQMSKEKNFQFYSALNMKLMTMDDEDFLKFYLFDQKQWKQIIQIAISQAFEASKKMLIVKKEVYKNKRIIFEKNDEIEDQIKTYSSLLNNLYRKCLRTIRLPEGFFINEDLDNYLSAFKFGIGARVTQIMLKNFPFVFRFQTRLKKLKEFIKADKMNHDRTLFLQEEVDPDLIIAVRRGYEFLDAYDACFYKDLRKKYKIVFFNEQGLEEEGIDGGGIIKEFINRVLKSSFKSVYGMFYENSQNQILPNYSSNMKNQYEFVGKIVGKAVYESIIIQQKFAEPFLNLLIGRQNSFQDLQFIDKECYHSMISIRKSSKQEIQSMCQTFTIQDIDPTGIRSYVNLKNVGSKAKGPQTPLTFQNKKQFVLSYADFKCNKQLQQKTRMFRKGFLTVMKSQWLTMFSNKQLNLIISGSTPNFSVIDLKNNVVFKQYNQKSQTILDLWTVLSQFSAEQKSNFLLYVTSCSRPPSLGFSSMKPLICIQKVNQVNFLPTANTCMNVLRLPDYRNKQTLKQKLLYAINSKAGFQFA